MQKKKTKKTKETASHTYTFNNSVKLTLFSPSGMKYQHINILITRNNQIS